MRFLVDLEILFCTSAIFFICTESRTSVNGPGTNVCTTYYRVKTNRGFFGWSTRYYSRARYECCSGWQTSNYVNCDLELCSWRSKSSVCWPAECGLSGLVSDCKCHPWFGGRGCMTITTPPTILFAGITLAKDTGGGTYSTVWQNNPNNLTDVTDHWFNKNLTRVTVSAAARWITTLTPKPNYINKTKTDIGINGASIKLVLRSANGTSQNFSDENCGNKSLVSDPEGSAPVKCQIDRTITVEHMTRLEVELAYTAGGFATVINLDRADRKETKREYTQASSSYKASFRWDFVSPFSNSTKPLHLSTEKVTKVGQQVIATWTDWKDDESQIYVSMTMQRLVAIGNGLSYDCSVSRSQQTVSTVNGSQSFTPKVPGVYAIVLSVFDLALNFEGSRRFFTFDPNSQIQIVSGTSANFSSAASNTSLQWQHNLDKPIVFTFSKGRFMNPVHSQGNWLGVIGKCPELKDGYDDHEGQRTTSAIRNNQGVVKLEIGYLQYRTPTRPTTPVPYKQVDIFSTTAIFDIPRKDGDTIEVFTKATDHMDRFLVETEVLRIDSSPPVVSNLNVTKEGNETVLAIQDVTELANLMLEWEAYDLETGVKQVEWSFYDEYSDQKDVILHGDQNDTDMGSYQGFKDMASCMNDASNASGDPGCYSTPYHSSFSKRFNVKPGAKPKHGTTDQPNTVLHHDIFIFLNVTVINWANLKTTVTKQIKVATFHRRMSASKLIGLAAGVPSGFLILIAIIIVPVVVLFVIRRRSKAPSGNDAKLHDEPIPMKPHNRGEDNTNDDTTYASPGNDTGDDRLDSEDFSSYADLHQASSDHCPSNVYEDLPSKSVEKMQGSEADDMTNAIYVNAGFGMDEAESGGEFYENVGASAEGADENIYLSVGAVH